MTPDLEPQILFQDPDWAVLAKPAGWLSVPGRSDAPLLKPWAEERLGELWVCHRLDRETSGAILFARNAQAHRQANSWFEDHKIKKLYVCLAAGTPPAPVFRIRRDIEGKPATTQVEVKESYREGFLAQVRTVSGRRHQIRIHLSEEGCPLWGDTEYKGPQAIEIAGSKLTIDRVALHALSLELPGGRAFEAPLPEDFKGWLERLRSGGMRV